MFSNSYTAIGAKSRAVRVAMAETADIHTGYWHTHQTPCAFGQKTANARPRGGST